MYNLKHCPFCGHDLNTQDFWHETVYPERAGNNIWSINCAEETGGCSAQILGSSESDVVKKWNNRAAFKAFNPLYKFCKPML